MHHRGDPNHTHVRVFGKTFSLPYLEVRFRHGYSVEGRRRNVSLRLSTLVPTLVTIFPLNPFEVMLYNKFVTIFPLNPSEVMLFNEFVSIHVVSLGG
jgi:hypothetical protein